MVVENDKLKAELETTKQCWTIDKSVWQRKVEDMENKFQNLEATLKDNSLSDLQARLKESELRASNQEIETQKYEALYEGVVEELQFCKPCEQLISLFRVSSTTTCWWGGQNIFLARFRLFFFQ